VRQIYEFKVEDAERFAQEQGIRTTITRGQLQFERCPYCRGETNKKNKFAISLKTGQFNCMRASCGAKGNMLTLAKDFGFSLGRDADTYYSINQPREYRTFKKSVVDKIEVKDAAIEYLGTRGISEDVVRKYKISATEEGRITFPFIDQDNRLQFTKYRNPNPKPGENKEWSEKNCKPILFGMAQCNLDNKTLIITEGQIDSLSVAEAGIDNAVSVPTGAKGFTWIPHCWDWIQNFDKIVVFGDHENGYITLYNDLAARFDSKVWHVREEDYKDCKDANDILRKYGVEQIRQCIANAEQKPIDKVIDITMVEDINPYDIEKMPTGIKDIDELLCGGLPFGQLILVTGKAGDGKSTFASQMLLSAIQNNYKCFAYSGELPNHLFKSWLYLQAAGFQNTYEEWSKWTIKRPRKVPDKVIKKIDEWYKGKLWLYDNSKMLVDGNESICELIEKTTIQYGTRVVLIDNLMTALDLEGSVHGFDKNDLQSNFIKKLARLALELDIVIILIAHQKKGYGEVNEMVSGSLDIVNLASIVLSYDRPTKSEVENGFAEKEDRLLRLTKNRLFGKIDNVGTLLKYDEASKRVYQTQHERLFKYGWETMKTQAEESIPPWEV
jgi:archaellum biogenesis ATPase FlaH